MRKGIIAAALIVVLVSGPVSAEDWQCIEEQSPGDFHRALSLDWLFPQVNVILIRRRR